MEAYFKKCEEKLGFVPNVLKAFAFDDAKLEAFVDYRRPDAERRQPVQARARDDRDRGVVAEPLLLLPHRARRRGAPASGDPVLGEMMVMNYRAARLDKRQRAMLDFAVKLTIQPWEVEEEDRERLRRAGFTDRDIWDIAAVAGFYNMTNRLASATDMRPNSVYHGQAR